MNYVIQYPPNTKDAQVVKHRFTVTVTCPHCGKTHHHTRAQMYMTCVKAPCGRGYYVLREKP
jgi:hypothetical protein